MIIKGIKQTFLFVLDVLQFRAKLFNQTLNSRVLHRGRKSDAGYILSLLYTITKSITAKLI